MTPEDKRKLTSRLNGLKSNGPKTAEGKLASSANSRTHAAYAKSLVLPGEKLADYQHLVDAHFQQWKPTNLIEENLVAQMATTLWRLNRQAPAESSLIQIQIQRMSAALKVEFEAIDSPGLYALAISALHSFGDGPAQIARQERRLLHQYQQLRQEILANRELFSPSAPEPANLQPDNLPTPQNENEIENEPVETNLTEPAGPLAYIPMLAAENRVHNPYHPLYAALPPIEEAPVSEWVKQAAPGVAVEPEIFSKMMAGIGDA